jgi:hypothetical protein
MGLVPGCARRPPDPAESEHADAEHNTEKAEKESKED